MVMEYKGILEKEIQENVNEHDWGDMKQPSEKLNLGVLIVTSKVCGIFKMNCK